MDSSWKSFSILFLSFSLTFLHVSGATDTLNVTHSIRDGETMVSPGGRFELGFFSPGNSRARYLGLWYRNLPVRTALWVANRENPLTNSTGGVLRVVEPGLLVLVNDTDGIVWSTNTSRPVRSPVAQLLETGNLVVRDANDDRPENFLWQSFDYPTDTYIPGMRIGWNLKKGLEKFFSSWRNDDDPSPGEYSMHMDLTGYPQIIMKRNSTVYFRQGPWNGYRFSGNPNTRNDPAYERGFVMNDDEVSYGQDTIDRSLIFRYTVGINGIAQRFTWIDESRGWMSYFRVPADLCDTYRLCGAYASCNIENSPYCGCLKRFVPRDPSGWDRADWSSGCVRRSNLRCEGDTFIKYSRMKLPDATYSWHSASMTLKECRLQCLQNCSCMAYTQLDIRRRIGCIIWYDDLVDMRSLSADGQDIYIRMAASEADSKDKKRVIIIASLTSGIGLVLISLSLFLCIRNPKMKEEGKHNSNHDNDSELPLIDLSLIMRATDHFSNKNKLGEGGFGPVYKGIMEEGQEIAVKRLSKDSMQGLKELKNEVIFIAKLQHRNLVKLLGCCIEGDEYMLIYEYMHNKSLDVLLFDQTKSKLLDWQTRFNIINGIARGLLYLHQDSRLRIIHRDLKASNILLDCEMNPKISDFGLARSFGGNETEARTRRVVGTYGYMSPEYIVDGLFSVKSDVFSFGVLVLEIVSGKRNRGFSDEDDHLNLLGHAWTLNSEGRPLELVDASLGDSFYSPEVLRSIHVGLLCVQRNPEDRPTMSSVVLMLSNEGVVPAEAKQPGFFTKRDVLAACRWSRTNSSNSRNEATITMLEAR